MSYHHLLVRFVPCFITACTSLPYELSQTKAALFCLTFFESASPSSASAVPFAVVQGRALCWSHHRRGLLPCVSGHDLKGVTQRNSKVLLLPSRCMSCHHHAEMCWTGKVNYLLTCNLAPVFMGQEKEHDTMLPMHKSCLI